MSSLSKISSSQEQSMSSTEIAKLTGKQKKHIHQDIKDQLLMGLYGLKDGQNLDHEKIQGVTIIFDSRGYWSEVFLDREHTLTLITGYDVKARHSINKRWIELENQKLQPTTPNTLPLQFNIQIEIAKAFASTNNISQTSQLRMFEKIGIGYGADMSFLPHYTDEKLTKSLTALLKEHGSNLTAVKANKELQALGIIREDQRNGSKGTIHKFWVITESGLRYGKNETSIQNPRETQPLWFVDEFGGLLSLIDRKQAA